MRSREEYVTLAEKAVSEAETYNLQAIEHSNLLNKARVYALLAAVTPEETILLKSDTEDQLHEMDNFTRVVKEQTRPNPSNKNNSTGFML